MTRFCLRQHCMEQWEVGVGITLWVTAHGSYLGLDVERPWSANKQAYKTLLSPCKGCISDTTGSFSLDGHLLVEYPDYNVEDLIMSWCG